MSFRIAAARVLAQLGTVADHRDVQVQITKVGGLEPAKLDPKATVERNVRNIEYSQKTVFRGRVPLDFDTVETRRSGPFWLNAALHPKQTADVGYWKLVAKLAGDEKLDVVTI
jgi:hypothetical protein